eukprot:1370621-Amorphochlora_amoeboformis.AAC.1
MAYLRSESNRGDCFHRLDGHGDIPVNLNANPMKRRTGPMLMLSSFASATRNGSNVPKSPTDPDTSLTLHSLQIFLILWVKNAKGSASQLHRPAPIPSFKTGRKPGHVSDLFFWVPATFRDKTGYSMGGRPSAAKRSSARSLGEMKRPSGISGETAAAKKVRVEFTAASDVDDGRHVPNKYDDSKSPPEWETKIVPQIKSMIKEAIDAST